MQTEHLFHFVCLCLSKSVIKKNVEPSQIGWFLSISTTLNCCLDCTLPKTLLEFSPAVALYFTTACHESLRHSSVLLVFTGDGKAVLRWRSPLRFQRGSTAYLKLIPRSRLLNLSSAVTRERQNSKHSFHASLSAFSKRFFWLGLRPKTSADLG